MARLDDTVTYLEMLAKPIGPRIHAPVANEAEQEQEPYVDQPFIRKVFKITAFFGVSGRTCAAQAVMAIVQMSQIGSLLGSSRQPLDGRTDQSGAHDPRSFN